jgi:hypothetical protein
MTWEEAGERGKDATRAFRGFNEQLAYLRGED